MFQMQEPERHRRRQKRIAHIFAPAVLQQMEPLIQGCVAKLVAQLRKRAGKEVDALHWCRMTVLDVGGESGLGGGPAISQMATYPLEHTDEVVGHV
jgi:cytochrome P450